MKSSLVGCVIAWLVSSCTSKPMNQVCVPGESKACIGPVACMGGQVCNSDGTGFSDCDCGEEQSDASTQMDASSVDSGNTTDAAPGDTGPEDGGLSNDGAVVDAGVQGPTAVLAAGTFSMGSPVDEPCREPVAGSATPLETRHSVTLTNAFEIQIYETTQAAFEAQMGYNPSSFSTCGGSCPVENVSWSEAAAFCNSLSSAVGLARCYDCSGTGPATSCSVNASYLGDQVYACPGWRLLTEAEWEYAYRAETTTAYYSGPNDQSQCTGSDTNADAIGWYEPNAAGMTHPVGLKAPNAWGLYDMAGNVWEWSHDLFVLDLGSSAALNPSPMAGNGNRTLRGGSWMNYLGGGGGYARDLRAAKRDQSGPDFRLPSFGFRCGRSIDTVGVQGPTTILPAGTFSMGSPVTEPCREPVAGSATPLETQHSVTLTHAFEIQVYETTQAAFEAQMGYNPSSFSACGPSCPVENVNWNEAAGFCNSLSSLAGLPLCYDCAGAGGAMTCSVQVGFEGAQIYSCNGWRLPTEAEWEYAYRAQTTTAYYDGANDPDACTGADAIADEIGWYESNAGGMTHPIAMKAPNAWGLYDMAGNVWEWNHDLFVLDLGSSPMTDPSPMSGNGNRALRGGSWMNYLDGGGGFAQDLRAAKRDQSGPDFRLSSFGFRCVRTW